MPMYEVTVTGDAREVYQVEAENELEAMERWHEGELVMAAEVTSAGPVSAREVEE